MECSDLRMSGRHPLSYCSNVHPATSLDQSEAVLRDQVAPCLRENLGAGPLLLGAWWPQDLVFALDGDEGRLRAHGELLDELGLLPASLNVFPQGRFHGAGVKESVYTPDWRSEERLGYTIAAARVQAALLAERGVRFGALSTVPLGFRGRQRDARPEAEHLRMVFRAAQALSRLADDTGVQLVLAIEPEPWCVLETVAEAAAWLGDELAGFAAAQGDEAAVRRHVGLCLDLCHAAVMGEDPVAALELCRRSGLRVPKVQLSSALHARGPRGYARALEYAEPVYLHQMREQGGGRVFVDLEESAARAHVPVQDEEWRVHFHVPLHWAGDEELGSTQGEVLRFVDAIRAGQLEAGTLLEVETYTNPSIAEELAFISAHMLRG
jgi:sugar phosphate isomerase/epimerase